METKGDMKYYSQYRIHDLFELQESLLGLSKSNRWVKLADRLPWAKIEKEYNKRLRNSHCGAGNKPARMVVGALIVKHVENLSNDRHAEEKRRALCERNEIEATFGTSKRVYRANDIRAKLDNMLKTEDIHPPQMVISVHFSGSIFQYLCKTNHFCGILYF